MIKARISGVGHYLPENQISNADLESKLDTTDEWISSRTGIRSRHLSQAHETTSAMASWAAAEALQDAGLTADEIDLIVVATITPNHFFPSMACHVQHAIGCKKPIPAFDVSAACSGFVYAMDVASRYIASGAARHVLVIGSETMSKAMDWTDRSVCVLFGDGAAGVVLSASEETGILASSLHAAHDADQYLTYPNTTHNGDVSTIGMAGSEVFKMAVNIMSDVVDEVLEASQLKKTDIKWLIPHQANIRIIQAIAKKLDMSMDQVVLTIEGHGNTSAASIPLALYSAVKNGQLQRNDLFLIESFGGGMTWGAMVLRY